VLPLDRQNQLRERYRQVCPGWQPSGEVYEAAVRQHMRAGMRVLDLGCGRGGLPEKLTNEISGTFGIDAHWRSLTNYRDACVRVCVGQAERLPFPADAFPLITAAWLLEHIHTPLSTLREIRRMLTPGGHFIFLTPNGLNPITLANRLSGSLPALQRTLVPRLYGRSPADTFPAHYRANTPRKLRQLARESGLQLLSLEAVRDPTYAAFSEILFRALIALDDLLPGGLGVHLVGVLQR
jgi:SAM-dependent methyltransferase